MLLFAQAHGVKMRPQTGMAVERWLPVITGSAKYTSSRLIRLYERLGHSVRLGGSVPGRQPAARSAGPRLVGGVRRWLSGSHSTVVLLGWSPKRASTLSAMRWRMSPPSRCRFVATQPIASRSQQSRLEATCTFSPFQRSSSGSRTCRCTAAPTLLLASVMIFPSCLRLGLGPYRARSRLAFRITPACG